MRSEHAIAFTTLRDAYFSAAAQSPALLKALEKAAYDLIGGAHGTAADAREEATVDALVGRLGWVEAAARLVHFDGDVEAAYQSTLRPAA